MGIQDPNTDDAANANPGLQQESNPDDVLLDLLGDGSSNPDEAIEVSDELEDVFGEPTHKYKAVIRGVEKVVTAEELLNHYQKGVRAEEKFNEAAELSKRSEQVQREAEQQRQQYLAHQNQMQQAIQQVLLQAAVFEQAEPDFTELLETNPQEYLRQKEMKTHRDGVKQQMLASLQYINQQKELDQLQYENNRLQHEGEVLLRDYFPEWRDPKVRESGEKEYLDYLKSQGYDDNAIQSLRFSQAKNIALVVKAMKYDKLLAKSKAAKKGTAATQQTEAHTIPTVVGNAAPINSAPSPQWTDRQFAEWRKKNSRSRS